MASNGVGTLQGQPWSKAGQVAAWAAYMAQEESNGWNGWFDLDVGTYRSNTPETMDLPYMEGQFDLGAELGTGLETIYLAVGLWGGADSDPMLPDYQAPEGNGDGNIDADEYAEVTLLDIQVSE